MDDRDIRLKRLHFRSHHRGTREADYMVGGFFDRYASAWTDVDIAWFEALMNEQDVDIIGWVMGTIAVPPHVDGPMMAAMQRLDYVPLPE